MGKRLSITLIGVLVFVIGFSSFSFAQMREGSISFTPQVGGFRFEDKQNFDHGYHVGIGLGYNFTHNLGAEFTFNFIRTAWNWKGTESDWNPINAKVNGYMYRGDLLYHFMPERKIVPYIAGGAGGLTLHAGHWYDKNTSFIANYGGGVKLFVSENVALRGDIRHVVAFDKTYHDIMYTLGVNFLGGGSARSIAPAAAAPVAAAPAPEPDSDGDGVFDKQDRCPNTPKGVRVDASGCPLDADGDGVADYLDKCPNTPSGVRVDASGCPIDSDGDGVADNLDKCPNTPKGVRVDASGCPLDADGDGVADYQDKCPNTPKGVRVDASGCPLDADGDGVADYLDKCPNTARDLRVDAQGCPILLKKKSTISLDIQFDHDKADIKPEYESRLKEVADFMAKYPETKAEIDGHTDSVGTAAYNMKLSQRRADSVRNYLIKNFNVSTDRITAKGFGESKPVAPNTTEEGRRQNRRIEAEMTAETETYEKK